MGRDACVRASLRAPCLSGYHRLRGGGGGDGVEIDLLDDDNGLDVSGEDQGGDRLILEDRTAEESLESLVHGVEYDVCVRDLVCVCVCVCVCVSLYTYVHRRIWFSDFIFILVFILLWSGLVF